MALQQNWITCCRPFIVNHDIVETYWKLIVSKYSEKQRYYHTLNHVTHMFSLFDEVRDKLSRPNLVAMAIFFHDLVYEPKEKDNEEKSAALFEEFSSHFETKHDRDSKAVYDWIIATKQHSTEVHRMPGVYGQDDLHYFLDMDMAILGTSDSSYKTYADNIRKEYIHIPELLFKEGRAKVLQSFLTVPNIYATEIFRRKFEDKARANIEAEIETLKIC
ncbi:uncharacterized protein LOC132750843 [Ruditapes philippinarum]|uniref:uncharacterized protein LOC132750843 n=1 Tax=Ruditapes philippinarum TaxID=129788 RepID=UPI00295B137C|nr:uncharacterized protein LOC132750843 [Ruditapes philippinarum]